MIGSTTIHCLGTVVHDRLNFHDTSDIFPVGYKMSRKMASMVHENQQAEYYGEIVEEDSAPVFKITCSDDPTFCVKSISSSGAWREACSKIKGKSISCSGPVVSYW